MNNDKMAEAGGKSPACEVVCPHCHAVLSSDGISARANVRCPACQQDFTVGPQVGKYCLRELLAEGKYARTYLAYSRDDGEQSAVAKIIPVEAKVSPEIIKALWTEAQVGEQLNDTDYVTGCLDYGISNGFYYLVRPFVQGETLDRFIARQGKLLPISALKLALHVLAGLQHLYRTGFLYRNLTPENVIVTPCGYAVLANLGQCRSFAEAAQATSCPPAVASSFYSPERLLGQSETIASEIYSVGMLLYFMLSGREYFTAEELADLTARRFLGKRPPVPSFSEFPGTLAIFLDAMLRFIPTERPQDYPEVADSIKALLTELEED